MTTTILILIFISLIAVEIAFLAIKLRNSLNISHQEILNIKNSVNKLPNLIDMKSREVENAIYLSQLDLLMPAFMGGWSIDTFLGKLIVQHLVEFRPKTILELGSGSSTLLIARTLQIMGIDDCTHIVVDHEQKYLDITRNYARVNNIDNKIKWLFCPLITYDDFDKIWYGDLLNKLNKLKIDLLLIDGPPGVLQTNSRYPAVPLLYPYLSNSATILLDDANRKDELAIVKDWIKLFPDFLESHIDDGHGIAILKRQLGN